MRLSRSRSPPELHGPMLKPGSAACAGSWQGRGKTIMITERDGQLILEMGADTPKLHVVPVEPSGNGVWPMKWTAVKSDTEKKDTLYVLELPDAASDILLVRRPVGDGVIEFSRVETRVEVNGSGPRANGAPQEQTPPPLSRRSRSGTQSRSRSRSRSRAKLQGGTKVVMPGDWHCPRCGDHQFARNQVCRSCSTPKPVANETAPGKMSTREALVSKVKQGQRESQGFKERWWEYCDKKGNGFYDPARHDIGLLEEFLKSESGGKRARSGSRSGSGSHSDSEESSSESRSRSRRKHAKRRRRLRRKRSKGRKKARGRSRRKRKGGKRKRKRSRSSSRSSSEADESCASSMPRREVAVRGAQAAVAEAEKELAKAREVAASEVAEKVRESTENQREEVERRVEQAKAEIEADVRQKLKETEAKLLDEKTARIREAEHRLDKAIASRLKEQEKKLAREVALKVDEARRAAVEATQGNLEDIERNARAKVASAVEEAEAQLNAAQQRLDDLKVGEKPSKEDGAKSKRSKRKKDGGDESPSRSSSESASESDASSKS